MPSSTAAPSSSSMRRVSRCDSEVEATACTGAGDVSVGDGSGLSGSRAAIGEGDAATGAVVGSLGAGITLTTAFGDGLLRRRVADGEGLGAAVGDVAALRVAVGRGGGGTTLDGELDACTPPGLRVALGVAVGWGLAAADAFGLLGGLGAGVGAAADAG